MSDKSTKPEQSSKTNYSVPNLERSFLIMEHLGQSSEGCTLTELVKLTGFPQNSIFRICRTLGELGYLSCNQENKRYQLTQRILNLAVGAVSPAKASCPSPPPTSSKSPKKLARPAVWAPSWATKVLCSALKMAPTPSVSRSISASPSTCTPQPLARPCSPITRTNNPLSRILSSPALPERRSQSLPTCSSTSKKLTECGYGVDREEEFAGQHCIGSAIRIPGRRLGLLHLDHRTQLPTQAHRLPPRRPTHPQRLPRYREQARVSIIRTTCSPKHQFIISACGCSPWSCVCPAPSQRKKRTNLPKNTGPIRNHKNRPCPKSLVIPAPTPSTPLSPPDSRPNPSRRTPPPSPASCCAASAMTSPAYLPPQPSMIHSSTQ